MISKWVLATTLLFSQNIFAAAAGFCGKIDLRAASNQDLVTLVSQNDLLMRNNVKRTQCGLTGETLNICSACSETTSEDAMRVLRPVLGSKEHSAWHSKWHKIRVGQEGIDANMFAKLQSIGLVPPAVSREEFFKVYGLGGALAGEIGRAHV